MLRAIKLAIPARVRDALHRGRHASAVALQALFSLYGISEISDDESLSSRWFRRASRRRVTVLYIKSPREKLWSPRGVSRQNTKRRHDPSFPAQCTGARRRVSARLHFETLSKLGNCIKSDLYLSVPGILAPRARCDVTNFTRLDER